MDRAFEELNAIQEASRKSKNLKGTIQSAINKSVVTLRGVLDDETGRLHADNEWLSREVSNMKTELKALRRDYEVGKTQSVGNATPATAPSSSSGVDIEDVVCRVTISPPVDKWSMPAWLALNIVFLQLRQYVRH